jgi:hypothetical protein
MYQRILEVTALVTVYFPPYFDAVISVAIYSNGAPPLY